MKLKAFLFSLFLLWSALAAFGQTSKRAANFDDVRRIEIFEQVWSIIEEKFYDPNFHGVDWKAVRERFRPLIETAENESRFYALLDEMAGELNDSHTRVYSPKAREDRRDKRSAGIGLSVAKVENKIVIAEAETGSEAARYGVKPGMVVVSVNGVPALEAFAKARTEVGASSSERSRDLRALSRMLSGAPNSTVKLELTDHAGKNLKVDLARRVSIDAPRLAEKLLSSGVVYIKFDAFSDKTVDELEKSIRRNRGASGLILDLRGNGGGDGEAGLRAAGFFLNEKVLVARLLTRTGKPPIPQIPMQMFAGADGKALFTKPLVILTGEKTASVSELVAETLQSYHRAYVIGGQTCGCVLGFIDYKPLKDGGELTVSEFGFVTAKNRRLEGAGVVPDKSISPSLEDLRRGRDAALEEAENFLSRLAKNNLYESAELF